jgi:serine/threonine protein kinase
MEELFPRPTLTQQAFELASCGSFPPPSIVFPPIFLFIFLFQIVSWCDHDIGCSPPLFFLHFPRRASFPLFDSPSFQAVQRATAGLVGTYQRLNPRFRYNNQHNPRRVLTKPSERRDNHGYDNAEADYILYVNDYIGSNVSPGRYQIVDLLGKGTFGQVVKCLDLETQDYVAIKIVKNLPAYHNQGLVEVRILELINSQFDTEAYPMVKLLDKFVFRNHLCLVMELLNVSLFELIRQNQFKGLSLKLISVFVKQILQCLCALFEARIMHCDLKPENILLEDATGPNIKVIDFGSAAMEGQSVYSYIQSRFYRSPEVILGLPYRLPIDIWSLGCICFELFVGLPLFPGVNQHRMLARFIKFLDMPPAHMLSEGKETLKFFNRHSNTGTIADWSLKTDEEYAQVVYEQQVAKARATGAAMPAGPGPIPPFRDYFKASSITDIVLNTEYKSHLSKKEREEELNMRHAMLHFLGKALMWDPDQRWIPHELLMHPFITGDRFTGDFPRPRVSLVPQSARISPTSPPSYPLPNYPSANYGISPDTTRDKPSSARRRSQPYQRSPKVPSGVGVTAPGTYLSPLPPGQPPPMASSYSVGQHQTQQYMMQQAQQHQQQQYNANAAIPQSNQGKKRRHSFAARSQFQPTGPMPAPENHSVEPHSYTGFFAAGPSAGSDFPVAQSQMDDQSAMMVDTPPLGSMPSSAMLGTTPSAPSSMARAGRGRRRAQSDREDAWASPQTPNSFQSPGKQAARWAVPPGTSLPTVNQTPSSSFKLSLTTPGSSLSMRGAEPPSPSSARKFADASLESPRDSGMDTDMNWPMEMDDVAPGGTSGAFLGPEDWDPLFSETDLLDSGTQNPNHRYQTSTSMEVETAYVADYQRSQAQFAGQQHQRQSLAAPPFSASLGTSPGSRPTFGSIPYGYPAVGASLPGSIPSAQGAFAGTFAQAKPAPPQQGGAFVFGFSPYDAAPGQHFPQTGSLPFGNTPSGNSFRMGPNQGAFAALGTSYTESDQMGAGNPWAPQTPQSASQRSRGASQRSQTLSSSNPQDGFSGE